MRELRTARAIAMVWMEAVEINILHTYRLHNLATLLPSISWQHGVSVTQAP